MSDFKPRFLKPSQTSSFLDRNDSSLADTTDFIYNRHLSQSIQTQRQKLPIFNNRNHILFLLEKYQTLVLVGETGCGKSTQIPQYMIEAGWPGQVGICESRRVAAISLANRVADETGSLVQDETVGYAVKFDACVKKPKIKYMTEGILLREMMSDPLLKCYSAIMLDEVHERTLYTDILMGLMKKIIRKRPEMRLIVASATMDAKELFDFFNNNHIKDKSKDSAVILSVKGRQFPVNIYYTIEPVPCYVQKSVETTLKINLSKESGDILIFLTGQEEVDRAVRLLKEHANNIEQANKKEKMFVLPMYGSLPYHEQLKVFKSAPDGYRKVVVATNVAETSITIPGIVHGMRTSCLESLLHAYVSSNRLWFCEDAMVQ
jgi:ATP-dependent RNA helicase DDX35